MNKWIAIIAALVIAGGAYMVLTPKDASESTGGGIRADVSNQQLLEYVPADTVYYFGGVNSKEVAEFMHNYKVVGMTPSQTAVWLELLNKQSEQGSKIASQLLYLFNAVIDNTDGTLADVAQYFGTDPSGSFAFYSDGIVPVLRIPVVDSVKFFGRLDEATNSSGVSFSEANLDEVTVKYWTVTEAQAEPVVKLAIAEMGNTLVMSFVSDKDDDAVVKQRLGIVKPAQSLAGSGEIRDLQKKYQYSDDMVFIVNFLRLAEGFFDSANSSFGKSLMHYLGTEKSEALSSELSDACKADYLSIVKKVPRLVGGYRELDIRDKKMNIAMHSVLEVKNTKVLNELTKLRGHVPLHTQSSKDKMLAMGVGLNLDNAVPAMMAIWNDFISAEFTCEQLVEAQDNARQKNPAMAGMVLGMVQGLKGLGFSLYGLELDTATMQAKTVSALFSAAAEDPQTLAAMAGMMPMLQGISIPDDGSEVDIPLPMLPANIQIKAAIKGKHLVVYTGDAAKQDLDKMKNEGIEENGLIGFALDYRKLGQAMDEMMALGSIADPSMALNPQSCDANLEIREAFAAMQVDFSMLTDVQPEGFVTTGAGSMDQYRWIDPEMVGEYKIETPDYTCQWQDIGVDKMRADGTGVFEQKDPDGECVIYSSNYTWKKTGMRLWIETQDGKSRDHCDAEWKDEKPEQQNCFIFAATKSGFQCKFDPLNDPATLRYTRM